MSRALAALAAAAAATGCLSSPGLLDVSEPRLSLTPSSGDVPPRGAVAFAARGGSGAGYRYSIAVNASGGAIDPGTGAYVAGARGDVTDVVQVEDSAGAVAQATASVGPAARILPTFWALPPGIRARFDASGGSGAGWQWTLAVNASGGAVEALDADSGLYTAGPTDGVDVLQATDSLGNVATARADIGHVALFPSPVTLVTGATQTFYGGSLSTFDPQVVWTVVEPGGGSIAATTPVPTGGYGTCTYVAPALPGTYHVQATSVADPTRSRRAEAIVVAP